MIELTDLEKKVLHSSRDNEYGDPAEDPVWVFSIIKNSGIESSKARGVISSLAKKGLAFVDDYEGNGKADDMVFSLTPLGVEMSGG
jgi:predicted transcriptional regulator